MSQQPCLAQHGRLVEPSDQAELMGGLFLGGGSLISQCKIVFTYLQSFVEAVDTLPQWYQTNDSFSLPFSLQRSDIVKATYEPTDEECEWKADDEQELTVSMQVNVAHRPRRPEIFT